MDRSNPDQARPHYLYCFPDRKQGQADTEPEHAMIWGISDLKIFRGVKRPAPVDSIY
jgi:hypothetical protein